MELPNLHKFFFLKYIAASSRKNCLGFHLPYQRRANGLRYPLVGGTRQRHFDETNFKPHKMLKNAQTPTSREHAVLARKCVTKCDDPKTLCCYHNPLVSIKNHFL